MESNVQREYERLVQKLENVNFTSDEIALVAAKLDNQLRLAKAAIHLWRSLPADSAFSSEPAMFMIKPPGDRLAIKHNEHIQWGWGRCHFMLFIASLGNPGKSMLGLFIDDSKPVLEIVVDHDVGNNVMIRRHEIYSLKVAEWIDDFLSYYGAFCRLRARSEAVREKYRLDMEAFWKLAGV